MKIGINFPQRFVLEAHYLLFTAVANTNHANRSQTKTNTKSQYLELSALATGQKAEQACVTPRDAHSNESDVSRHAGITSLRMHRSEVVILRMDCNIVLGICTQGSRKGGIFAFVRAKVFI